MATIAQALSAAVKHHQAGNLAQAERLYREILQRDQQQADAWHLLGLVALARNQCEQAVEQIGRAIELDPRQASFHNHLGEAYRVLARWDEAETSCRHALSLKPDFAIAHNTLGTLLDATGDVDGAIASYRQAISLAPDLAQAHYNLGLALQSHGRLADAEASYRRAIAAKPDYPLALHNLGVLLQGQSRLEEAIACFGRALAQKPDYTEAHCNLGSALKDQGRATEAIESYRRALALDPDLAEAHFNLGVVYQSQDQFDQAAECYRSAIRARPNYGEAHSNLGTIRKLQGKLAEAMQCYDTALGCDDNLAEAHRNRSLLRLLQGNFSEGWPEHEWRRRVPGIKRSTFRQPQWSGEEVPDGAVLLAAEQGLGDTIQFVRYAPLVKARSRGRVFLYGRPRLEELLTTVEGIDRFVPDANAESFDYYVPMMSLPAIFGTTLETIPADVPYVAADSARIEHWRQELSKQAGFKVGIAWQGNPAYQADAERSVPLGQFAPLADCPGVRLFSLQKEHGCDQLAPLAERLRVVDLGAVLDEQDQAFVDTAAAMKALDLIVTSDSAVAHLAGALGVAVWVALPRIPDWRWLLDRQDSPWYPTMRLFRQTRAGDWGEVFARIAAELASLSSRDELD